ncbi:MAG: alpha/beta hydrolase [Betaproteobacteria bacterium]|nr:alpha/beta hydrolase [Betaproteobacteria bacterium]MBA3775805.1 alpha/beta hydrolase [Betaproteobacteria bacterium]
MKCSRLIVYAAAAAALVLNSSSVFAQGGASKSERPAAQASKGQFADINGNKIYYTMQGRGQPLILIHGFPLNSGLFHYQIQALSEKYQLVLLDLPGFGQSRVAADSEGSLQGYARTVLGLMDQLKIDKAIIGGHSMGGMTAIEMYKVAPERFSGMILIDTTAKPASVANQAWWKGFGEQAEKTGVDSMAPIFVPQMLSETARAKRPELVRYTEGLIKAATVAGVVGGGKALAERPDNTSVLESVKVPTLIMVGSEDSLTPLAMSKDMNAAIKGSKLVVLEGASHAPVLEDPHRANDAILEWAAQIKSEGPVRPVASK